MGEGAGIDDQPSAPSPSPPGSTLPARPHGYSGGIRSGIPVPPPFARSSARNVLQGLLAVDLRLPGPKQVQIGAVQDVDRFGHGVRRRWNIRPCAEIWAETDASALYQLFRRSAKSGSPARGRPERSAGRVAALLPHLFDLCLELVVRSSGAPGTVRSPIKIERRALQLELLRKVAASSSAALTIGSSMSFSSFSTSRFSSLPTREALLLVGLAGLGEELLVHLEIFALLVGGERDPWRRPRSPRRRSAAPSSTTRTLPVAFDELDQVRQRAAAIAAIVIEELHDSDVAVGVTGGMGNRRAEEGVRILADNLCAALWRGRPAAACRVRWSSRPGSRDFW